MQQKQQRNTQNRFLLLRLSLTCLLLRNNIEASIIHKRETEPGIVKNAQNVSPPTTRQTTPTTLTIMDERIAITETTIAATTITGKFMPKFVRHKSESVKFSDERKVTENDSITAIYSSNQNATVKVDNNSLLEESNNTQLLPLKHITPNFTENNEFTTTKQNIETIATTTEMPLVTLIATVTTSTEVSLLADGWNDTSSTTIMQIAPEKDAEQLATSAARVADYARSIQIEQSDSSTHAALMLHALIMSTTVGAQNLTKLQPEIHIDATAQSQIEVINTTFSVTATTTTAETAMTTTDKYCQENIINELEESHSKKQPTFINDNFTNSQQMNLPNRVEVWSLAGMKTTPRNVTEMGNEIIQENSKKQQLQQLKPSVPKDITNYNATTELLTKTTTELTAEISEHQNELSSSTKGTILLLDKYNTSSNFTADMTDKAAVITTTVSSTTITTAASMPETTTVKAATIALLSKQLLKSGNNESQLENESHHKNEVDSTKHKQKTAVLEVLPVATTETITSTSSNANEFKGTSLRNIENSESNEGEGSIERATTVATSTTTATTMLAEIDISSTLPTGNKDYGNESTAFILTLLPTGNANRVSDVSFTTESSELVKEEQKINDTIDTTTETEKKLPIIESITITTTEVIQINNDVNLAATNKNKKNLIRISNDNQTLKNYNISTTKIATTTAATKTTTTIISPNEPVLSISKAELKQNCTVLPIPNTLLKNLTLSGLTSATIEESIASTVASVKIDELQQRTKVYELRESLLETNNISDTLATNIHGAIDTNITTSIATATTKTFDSEEETLSLKKVLESQSNGLADGRKQENYGNDDKHNSGPSGLPAITNTTTTTTKATRKTVFLKNSMESATVLLTTTTEKQLEENNSIDITNTPTTTKTSIFATPKSIEIKIEDFYKLIKTKSSIPPKVEFAEETTLTTPTAMIPNNSVENTSTNSYSSDVVVLQTTTTASPPMFHMGSVILRPTVANYPGGIVDVDNVQTKTTDDSDETDINVIIAITVSIIGVVALILLVTFLYLMRKRQKQMSYGQRCRPVSLDAYSMDNVSVLGSVRRKSALRSSKRSYGNVAFDDPALRHNVLNAVELGKFMEYCSNIFEEFRDVPQITARADEVPPGCEDKNRYANVIPLPETRVVLQQLNDDDKMEYINANYVRGPKDASNYYIACQAPLESTVCDFWRMIWEQQSRVIIQATDLIENGIEKCAEYLPPSVTLDNHTTYGDYQITLKNREVKEKYAISTIILKHTTTNKCRELTHYWYKWPEIGVPSEEAPVIAMLLEARSSLKSYAIEQVNELKEKSSILTLKSIESDNIGIDDIMKTDKFVEADSIGAEINANISMDKFKATTRNQGPLTIHCSPGTGRTGTIIACDIAIRSLEAPTRSVDIPQIVYYVRRGRASAVQTKEQYEFIYKVALMYATKITNLSNDN